MPAVTRTSTTPPPTSLPLPRLLTLQDVSRWMGVSRLTITAWVRAGRFPAPLPLGRRRLYWNPTDVQSWLAGQGRQHGAGAEAGRGERRTRRRSPGRGG
jgi:prophage regulatory protein